MGDLTFIRLFSEKASSPTINFWLACNDFKTQTCPRMKIEHFALQVPEPVAMAEWYVKHLGFTVSRAVPGRLEWFGYVGALPQSGRERARLQESGSAVDACGIQFRESRGGP